MKPKIYIDCSSTYYSNFNTGIQRVVRNIVKNLPTAENDRVYISAVVLGKKEYNIVEAIPEVTFSKNKNWLRNILKKIYILTRDILSLIPGLKKYLLSAKMSIFFNNIYNKLLFKQEAVSSQVVEFKNNDILLLLDSTWLKNDFNYLKDLKKEGVIIISVIYDLIPISHKQFCTVDAHTAFVYWFEQMKDISSGFISISNTVKNDVANFLGSTSKQRLEYFHLGANMVPNEKVISVDHRYKSIFNKNNTYITVSTIEPRKNHEYILNSFEELWESGYDVKYAMVGRIGWDNDTFLKRVKQHKEYNKKLFLLDDVDDKTLEYAYQHSKALIFASFTEGFGLPIIESLFHQTQVLASDIPIHHEVGRDFVTYFDISDSQSLIKLITEDNFTKNIEDFQWLSWEESTDELITKTLLWIKE